MALFRSIATVGGFTLVSRVLGFVRDLLIAAVLGTGPAADAFFVAFRLPNLFRRLFAEGAFNAAFIPSFARRLEGEGIASAKRLAEEVQSVWFTGLLAMTVAAEIAMPAVVFVLALGFADDAERWPLAVEYSRITFPYLMLMSLTALLGGVLNALNRFAAAAAAPIALNVCMIAAMVIAAPHMETAGHALAWGVTIGGVVQVAMVAWDCRRAGVILMPRLPRLTPGVRRVLRLMGPGAIGAGVLQVNILVGTIIASFLPTGAVSYLYYADRLYQLPLGVIGIAIGTALLPQLSREVRAGRLDGAVQMKNRSIEIAMLLTLPAAVALMTIPGEIVLALFQRGAFGAADVEATAYAVAAFAAGLPAYVLIKVLSPGFWAREDTRTPVIYAAISVAANIVFSLILVFPLGHVGIALATALAAWLNAGLLAAKLRALDFLAADSRLLRRLPRILLASGIMALGLLAGAWATESAFLSSLEPVRLAALAGLCAGGLALYAAAAQMTGALDLGELRRALTRRPANPAAAS